MALVRSPPPWRVHSQLTSRRLCSLVFQFHCKLSGQVNQKLNSKFSPHHLQKKGSCLYQRVIDVDAEGRVDNRKESGDYQEREPPKY